MSVIITVAAVLTAAAAAAAALHWRARWQAACRSLAAAHLRHHAHAAALQASLRRADVATARLIERCARLQQHIGAVDAPDQLPTPADVDAEIWADIVRNYGETADEPGGRP